MRSLVWSQAAALDVLGAVCLGFAFAGLVASAFELATGRPIGFRLLKDGGAAAFATVPILVFSAPLIIVRNTIRGRRTEPRSTLSLLLATAVAAAWSSLCGRVVLDALGCFGA